MLPISGTSIMPMKNSLSPHVLAVGSIAPTRISLMTTIAIVDAGQDPERDRQFHRRCRFDMWSHSGCRTGCAGDRADRARTGGS